MSDIQVFMLTCGREIVGQVERGKGEGITLKDPCFLVRVPVENGVALNLVPFLQGVSDDSSVTLFPNSYSLYFSCSPDLAKKYQELSQTIRARSAGIHLATK